VSVQVYYELVEVEGWAGVRSWALRTHHWFYGLFKSAPDLIALLLPVRGTKWTAKRILSRQLTDLVSRWSNVPPLLRPTCRAGRHRGHQLPAGERASRWRAFLGRDFGNRGVFQGGPTHAALPLLCPYSFSDLDALMRFLNLRLK
jgi:hypothetical protein